MSLPTGVTKRSGGALTFVTQRGWWAPPYTSCMLACLAMLLEWAGYRLPLKRPADAYAGTNPQIKNLVLALHLATGRPLISGTTLQDSQTALVKLGFPDGIINFGTLTKAEIRSAFNAGAQVRFSARPLSAMPKVWKLPAGYSSDGGHAFVGLKTRWNSLFGYREIKIVDVMFRPWTDYDEEGGQWVPFVKFLEFCDTDTDGEFIVTWAYRGAALA